MVLNQSATLASCLRYHEVGARLARWLLMSQDHTGSSYCQVTQEALGAKPAGTVGRIAMPVAGDDLYAKAVAQKLVDAAGFDPVEVSDLADSWRQQPGTPAYCTELTMAKLKAALASAVKDDALRNRDALMTEFTESDPSLTHETFIARNR